MSKVDGIFSRMPDALSNRVTGVHLDPQDSGPCTTIGRDSGNLERKRRELPDLVVERMPAVRGKLRLRLNLNQPLLEQTLEHLQPLSRQATDHA